MIGKKDYSEKKSFNNKVLRKSRGQKVNKNMLNIL